MFLEPNTDNLHSFPYHATQQCNWLPDSLRTRNFANFKVSVKENEVPAEKNSSREYFRKGKLYIKF